MVYSFAVGLAAGIPFGVYLRENDLHHKLQAAFRLVVPQEEIVKKDKFRNHSKDFFDDIRKGRKDPKDFERYIFGNHRAYVKDDRDRAEDEERKYTDSIRRGI